MTVVLDKPKEVQGVQSLETGLHLFEVFMQGEHPSGLSELARRVGMHRAKAYRYLISLQRAGWVDQDQDGRGYVPGPAARDLALSWLGRQDMLAAATEAARKLCLAHGLTCFVAACSPFGATSGRTCCRPRWRPRYGATAFPWSRAGTFPAWRASPHPFWMRAGRSRWPSRWSGRCSS